MYFTLKLELLNRSVHPNCEVQNYLFVYVVGSTRQLTSKRSHSYVQTFSGIFRDSLGKKEPIRLPRANSSKRIEAYGCRTLLLPDEIGELLSIVY